MKSSKVDIFVREVSCTIELQEIKWKHPEDRGKYGTVQSENDKDDKVDMQSFNNGKTTGEGYPSLVYCTLKKQVHPCPELLT